MAPGPDGVAIAAMVSERLLLSGSLLGFPSGCPFWQNDEFSIEAMAHALGFDIVVVFEFDMHDPSVMRIHLAKGYGLSCAFHFL